MPDNNNSYAPEGYILRYDTATGQPTFMTPAQIAEEERRRDEERRQRAAAHPPTPLSDPAPTGSAFDGAPRTADADADNAAVLDESTGAVSRSAAAPAARINAAADSARPAPRTVYHAADSGLAPSPAVAAFDGGFRTADAAPDGGFRANPPAPAAKPVRPEQCAGFLTRLAAFAVDGVITWLLGLLVRLSFGGLFSALGAASSTPVFFSYSAIDLAVYAVTALYFILMTKLTGWTVGKRLLRLRVVAADGGALRWFDVVYRETIGRYLSAFFCIGYLVLAFDREHRGFHDMLCDTRVIYMECGEARTGCPAR